MGRPLGKKTEKDKFLIKYLDVHSDNLHWEEFRVASYEKAIELLKEKYDVEYTRDILQNIKQQKHKKIVYPNIKVTNI